MSPKHLTALVQSTLENGAANLFLKKGQALSLAVVALLAVCKAHGESQSPMKAARKMGPMGGDWIKVIREGLR